MCIKQPPYRQSGFSLVEIMVAMVIGLLTTLVIMQVFSVFEGQKRATTGTADAQTSGAIALYTIGRDLQMAGFGLIPATDSGLECTPPPTIDNGQQSPPWPATPTATNPISTTGTRINLDLSPVIITDGGAGAGASDTISIVYGTNAMAGVPVLINSLVGTTATIDNNLGCRPCDIALVMNGPACTATTVIGPTTTAMTCPNAVIPAFSTTTTLVLQDTAGVAAGAYVACVGTWNRIAYRINNGNLEVNGVPTLTGIVNIQAQYGISPAANSNQINQWVDANAVPWNASPLAIADRNRIKAVRLAIVARNGVQERDVVSTACSSTTAANPTGVCAWAGSADNPAPAISFNLATDPNWANYRYRVFETIIPLRNMIWAKETL